MDNLTQKMIKDGSLKKRVQEEGLRGITSNPSIFQKAISGSNDYDEQMIELTERRANENKTISEIHFVASFFLSRIDVLVDKQLGHKIKLSHFDQKDKVSEVFLGKTAIAHAKIAYRSFRKVFTSPRWKKLSEKGAQFQRPLWASTGTKNPIYSDVYYIEPLIAPDTEITMPEATIDDLKIMVM